MLRFPAPDAASAAESFALAALADLARLPVVREATAPVVDAVVDREGNADDVLGVPDFGLVVEDGAVRIPAALLAGVTGVAGAAVEQGVTVTDRYGRVPSRCNPQVMAGREREPVISQAAVALRAAVRRAAGRRPVVVLAPWPDGHRWAAAMTHDLDVVDWWPVFTALRLAELARRGGWGRALRVLGAALRTAVGDPVWRAADDVLAIERRLGLVATWFILCDDPTVGTMRRGDLTYRPEGRRARRIVAAARAHGAEIALHGSFATYTDGDRFRRQRGRLAQLAATEVIGVRQHFVRMRPGLTHALMREAGFVYDSSYAFPDRSGFRLGVADVLPGWDARGARMSALDEVPVTWMDRALSKYRGVEDPRAWVEDALDLAARCRAVEGLWVGLWHPNLAPSLGFPDAPQAFAQVVEGVLAARPWTATLSDVVEWRRLRRAAVVRGVRPDGRVELDADARVVIDPVGDPGPLVVRA